MKKGFIIIGLIFGLTIFLLFLSPFIGYLKAASPQIGKPSDKPQPDLVVEKVWLDLQCHIHFKIKNAGNGSISDAEHSKGVVRVYYGREHEDFYFTRASSAGKPALDAAGALRSPGGSVQYDTQIKLESPMSVVVHVDADKKIMESNEENNRITQSITPQCPASAQTTPAQAVRPSDKGFDIDVDKDKIKPARERERRLGQDFGDSKLQQAPVIIIDEPREWTRWFAGCQYKIAWRSNVEMGFKIKIMFIDDVAWTITPQPLKLTKVGDYYAYSTSWTVPDGRQEIAYPYSVKVESLDGKFSRQREYLNILTDGLQMVMPSPPEVGSSPEIGRTYKKFLIIWNYWGCTFRTFDIILEPVDPPNLEPMYIQRALGLRPETKLPDGGFRQTFPWMVPPSVPTGIYNIKVVGHRIVHREIGRGDPSVIGGPITIINTGK